jgi:hypothetical protein
VSLAAVRKRVLGIHGREEATHQTQYPTWAAFEDDMTHIWNNARLYNEDGSDIYNVSLELEVSIHNCHIAETC